MSFLDKVTAFLPLGKKEEKLEYFFAVNIGLEKVTVSLWTIAGRHLKISEIASENLPSNDQIIVVIDKLLDQVLGLKEIEPQKILFGVPNSWLLDDNLKDEYLKVLRNIVKELEVVPMAYVSTSKALAHFLEKQEGVPTTAILVGFEKMHLCVTVVRAGKFDGVKYVKRGESAGADIEKALLQFTDVETLPSKILIYGSQATQLKSQLLSFSWMSKLSFLHFPKIEVLDSEIEIKSVCLAGGSEIDSEVIFVDHQVKKQVSEVSVLEEDVLEKTGKVEKAEKLGDEEVAPELEETTEIEEEKMEPEGEPETKEPGGDNLGFVVGDVAKATKTDSEQISSRKDSGEHEIDSSVGFAPSDDSNVMLTEQTSMEIDDFENEDRAPAVSKENKRELGFRRFIPKKFPFITPLLIFIVLAISSAIFLYLMKADIKIFVEPQILEKEAQVIADPNQKTVDEAAKIIPGQIIDVEVSGTAKETATGSRQIGDPAKGTVVVYNKTSEPVTLSKGTQITGTGGLKFILDTSVNIASQSASDSGITFGKANSGVTATVIGADGNLPSGSNFSVASYSNDKVAAKSEGNFSGGTSKDVTVISKDDAERLLAKVTSELRQQAQQKLQEKYANKKILTEALLEKIVKKSYSKNINDQASEFSLNMTIRFKGTSFDDADLKAIVSKLVTTQVPEGFELNLSETETQADVSKLEKDGKLIFLAKFRAKLIPKINADEVRNKIKFKTTIEAQSLLKGMEHILDSEITLIPSLPGPIGRLPIFSKNIKVEVGLK